MLQIATSNGWINWQENPKIERIRIQQPKNVDNKTCPVFPVMGVETLACISRATSLFFFVPQVLIAEPAHTSNFFVFCNGIGSDFMASACTFARASVWSDLAGLDIAWAQGTGSRHAWHWLQAKPVPAWVLQVTVTVCSLHFDSLDFDRQNFPGAAYFKFSTGRRQGLLKLETPLQNCARSSGKSKMRPCRQCHGRQGGRSGPCTGLPTPANTGWSVILNLTYWCHILCVKNINACGTVVWTALQCAWDPWFESLGHANICKMSFAYMLTCSVVPGYSGFIRAYTDVYLSLPVWEGI